MPPEQRVRAARVRPDNRERESPRTLQAARRKGMLPEQWERTVRVQPDKMQARGQVRHGLG